MKYISEDGIDVLRETVRRIYDAELVNECRDLQDRIDRKVHFAVNWGSFGSSTPDEARAYAKKITAIAELADYLNWEELRTIDRDYDITDHDSYIKACQMISTYLEDFDIDSIKAWLYARTWNPGEIEMEA